LSAALKEAVDDPAIVEKLLALGVTADFVPGDKQRDINVSDITAWKKVATEAKIEIK
jgi:hypothetical protein